MSLLVYRKYSVCCIKLLRKKKHLCVCVHAWGHMRVCMCVRVWGHVHVCTCVCACMGDIDTAFAVKAVILFKRVHDIQRRALT